jgi:hypothetical protein
MQKTYVALETCSAAPRFHRMSNSNDLLTRAHACETHARLARELKVRALLLGLAKQWRELNSKHHDRPISEDLCSAESRLTRRSTPQINR